MIWKLVDRDTGKENSAIEWTFRVGDEVTVLARSPATGFV